MCSQTNLPSCMFTIIIFWLQMNMFCSVEEEEEKEEEEIGFIYEENHKFSADDKM